jgi:malate dehydrogenase
MTVKKVAIIGAGNVGASIAQQVAQSGTADIALFDVVEGMPQGKALDIQEACPLWDSSSRVEGANDYGVIDGADVVVITAGVARKPGMSRDDLLNINAGVVRAASIEIAGRCPKAVVIVVTNPMDAMAQLAMKTSGFAPARVMGMGGVLDAARFRTFVALELGVSPGSVEAMVMGGHGDQMVPVMDFSTVGGVPLRRLLSEDRIRALVERTKSGGAEIVALLKTGSAYYAPAASTFKMIRAVLFDEKRVLAASCMLSGQYGCAGVYAGAPAVLGAGGVERILEPALSPDELGAFKTSAGAVRELCDKLGI